MSDSPVRTPTYERAPKSVLETSKTDAVADELRRRGVEPGYEEIARFAPPLKYVNSNFKIYPLVLGEKDGTSKIRLLADGSELHLGIQYDKRPCGLEFASEWFGAEMRVA